MKQRYLVNTHCFMHPVDVSMKSKTFFEGKLLSAPLKRCFVYMAMKGNNTLCHFSFSEVCPVPCSAHSVCVAGRCQCEEGWEGTTCDKQACHPICEEHGECRDGQCVCQPGWEGEHCTIGKFLLVDAH